MTRLHRMALPHARGFTLVETVLSLGISTLFLAGIFTLLSVGLSTSKEAADDATVGLILRESANRMRGREFRTGTPPIVLYFDNRGGPVEQTPEDAQNNFYCAVATVSTPAPPIPNANLLAVVVRIYDKVTPEPNAPVPPTAPKTTFSLQMTSVSGQGWEALDPTYVRKIDL